jgi:hypothetical protein
MYGFVLDLDCFIPSPTLDLGSNRGVSTYAVVTVSAFRVALLVPTLNRSGLRLSNRERTLTLESFSSLLVREQIH